MTIETKPTDQPQNVTREEHTKAVEAKDAEISKIRGEFETMRNQLINPDYIAYLNNKNKKPTDEKVTTAIGELTSEEIESLPKARLLKLAEERTGEKITKTLTAQFNSQIENLRGTVEELIIKEELREVQGKYADFNDYRVDVKKILESSTNELTIEQAYKIAKATRPPKEEEKAPEKKEKSAEQSKGSEKPTGSVPFNDLEKKEFKNEKEAGQAALEELRKKYPNLGDTL